jgi:hypothetical protein
MHPCEKFADAITVKPKFFPTGKYKWNSLGAERRMCSQMMLHALGSFISQNCFSPQAPCLWSNMHRQSKLAAALPLGRAGFNA